MRARPPSARRVATKLGDPLSPSRGLAGLFVNGFDRFQTPRGRLGGVCCRSWGRLLPEAALLNHFLELTPEHSSVVAIKRDMEPIAFLALDDEFVRVAVIERR